MNDMVESEVLAGPRDLEAAKESQKALNNFIASQMREGTDFGIIPGTKRKSLWQPGAQKLLFFNGLGTRIEAQPGTVQDFNGGFFHYEYKAIVFHKQSGKMISECVGSANSLEPAFRWQSVPEYKVPRGVNKDELEYEDRIFANKDGSEKTVRYYKTENDARGLVNNIQKRAQKRAMIGAALLACRASENFTHDEVEEEDVAASKPEKNAAHPAASAESNAPAAYNPVIEPVMKAPSPPISEPQRKRLFAIQKNKNVSDASLAAFLGKTYPYVLDSEGQVHTSKLAWKNYENVVAWVEAQ